MSLDPRTGRVLAMSGGWSADLSKFNRATQAQRQPGSSFKPFVYLTAMEQGISPSARFSDGPFSLGDWHPNDYEMTYGGPTPLRVALEESLNLVTIRVAQKVGMDAVAKTAIDFHLVDGMPRVLPAALGAVETTVLREAGAYASLEEGGRVVQPTVIDSVQDRDGHVSWRPSNVVMGAGRSGAAAGSLGRASAIGGPGERVPGGEDDGGRGALRHRRSGRGRLRPAARRQDRHQSGLQ